MSTTDVAKWADTGMYAAEPMKEEGVRAFVLSAPADPLGGVAACIKMYKGEVVRDLADVTDTERREALEQIQKTILAMPLEAVQIHFMLEGVHRGITHQMVRQRTAAYAQESTRFAVKEDATSAIALPPSLAGTLSHRELAQKIRARDAELGLRTLETDEADDALVAEEYRSGRLSPQQKQRIDWDYAVNTVGETYLELINSGMPAEEARGLLATNLRTRLHYITNLRNFYVEMGKRLSDQAQFEWRQVAMAYALALREYGRTQSYWTTITKSEYGSWDQRFPKTPILERKAWSSQEDPDGTVKVRLSSEWQYVAITNEMKPSDFIAGRRTFAANFDRPSRIGERVDEFARRGVPSSEWTRGSEEHGIPPIHPEEWLFDPDAARLTSDLEFDVFGNRVPKGTGWHFDQSVRNGGGRLITRAYKRGDEDFVEHKTWPQDFPEGTTLA